jgi:hypothetical protein
VPIEYGHLVQPTAEDGGSLSYVNWLRDPAVPKGAVVENQHRFQRSVQARVDAPNDAPHRLANPTIDYLVLYGRTNVLGLKRVSGFLQPSAGTQSVFSYHDPTCGGGSARAVHCSFEDGYICDAKLALSDGKVDPGCTSPVDVVSLTFFRSDIPHTGDWISVETKRYSDREGIFRFALLSVADFSDVRLWGISANPGAGEFLDRVRFRHCSPKSLPNPRAYLGGVFLPVLSQLDQQRTDPSFATPDVRDQLAEFLSGMDVHPQNRHQAFADLIKDVRPFVGQKYFKAENSGGPFLLTFRFGDPH